MRKILFGALVGAAAMYFLDPERGSERRRMIAGMWRERQDTVLEAARTTAGAVSQPSPEVGSVVGQELAELRPKTRGGNGAPVAKRGG